MGVVQVTASDGAEPIPELDAMLNAGVEALDRGAGLRWSGGHLTHDQLLDRASRFGGMLRSLGVQRRDVVCGWTDAIPELVVALLGTLRYGAVFGVLDGPGDARLRHARLLLLDGHRKPKIDRSKFPELWHVVALGPVESMGAGDFLFDDTFGPAPRTEAIRFGGAERALVTSAGFWSHQAAAAAAHRIGRKMLGLRPGDLCSVTLPATDPMWPVVGVLAPLSAGAEVVLGDAPAVARVGEGPVRLGGPDGAAVPQTRDGRAVPDF